MLERYLCIASYVSRDLFHTTVLTETECGLDWEIMVNLYVISTNIYANVFRLDINFDRMKKENNE